MRSRSLLRRLVVGGACAATATALTVVPVGTAVAAPSTDAEVVAGQSVAEAAFAGAVRSPLADQHFTGTGNSSVSLSLVKGLVVFDAAVTGGTSNYIVWLRKMDESYVGLVANAIGDYSGSVALRIPVTGRYHLDITSDGTWTVTARQPRATTAPATRLWRGQGNVVTGLFALTLGTYRFTWAHQGERNFIVRLVDLDGNVTRGGYLVNKIGAVRGTTTTTVWKTGVYVLSVQADGPWQIAATSVYIAYRFSTFTVPTTAKRSVWFTMSVRLVPKYIGPSTSPVTMYIQKKSGSRWIGTLHVHLTGADTAAYTKYSARASLSAGTWRVWATFRDANHRAQTTGYKYITVR